MPVENEFKYVLYDPDIKLLASIRFDNRWTNIEITQAYLNDGCRIRKALTYGDSPQPYESTDYTFTYKTKVGDEVIEIEVEITEEDFNKLKSVAKSSLTKTRFEYYDGENCTWAVDYFWNEVDDNPYFVMAEFETKYDIRTAPPPMDKFKDYVVQCDDVQSLTSHKLTDKTFATLVMASILMKTGDVLRVV